MCSGDFSSLVVLSLFGLLRSVVVWGYQAGVANVERPGHVGVASTISTLSL